MELLTDEQYAAILLDEIAELDAQILPAKEESALRTAEELKKTRHRKQEKLDIILSKM